MSTLKSLTFVATPPKPTNNPTAIRRERLVQCLQEQLELAKDPSFAPVVTRWKKSEDGVNRPVGRPRRLTTRYPFRDHLILLLSVRAGLRAKEIAALKWEMITDTEGQLADVITLTYEAAKGRRGGELFLWRRNSGRL